MPQEAFIELKELVGLHHKITPLYCRCAVGAFSYCWRTPEHPDPEGESLLLMADALEACYEQQRTGVFQYKEFPRELGLFIDWCSLFQKDSAGNRTDEEQRCFKASLHDLDLWYAHEWTTVWLLTNSGVDVPYYGRGWPTYESRVASVVKKQFSFVWPGTIDVGAPDEASHLKPPTPAAQFKRLLEDLKFTNGADRNLVGDLYETTLSRALGGARELVYERLDESGLEALAACLHLCTRLKSLNVKYACLDMSGVEALAACVQICTRLETLKLEAENRADSSHLSVDAGMASLAVGLVALPNLRELKIEGGSVGAEGMRALGSAQVLEVRALEMPFVNFDGRAFCGFVDEIERHGTWGGLETLWLNYARFPQGGADDSFLALAAALERGALASLRNVYAIGVPACAATWERLRAARPDLELELT